MKEYIKLAPYRHRLELDKTSARDFWNSETLKLGKAQLTSYVMKNVKCVQQNKVR